MKNNILLVLTSAGLIFSGYLSGKKLLDGTCAFNESCPYFLGYPTCYYGFALFFAMFATVILARLGNIRPITSIRSVLGLSTAGVLFAGYYSMGELLSFKVGFTQYFLGLPTCAYGLIVYIALFVAALTLLRKNP